MKTAKRAIIQWYKQLLRTNIFYSVIPLTHWLYHVLILNSGDNWENYYTTDSCLEVTILSNLSPNLSFVALTIIA